MLDNLTKSLSLIIKKLRGQAYLTEENIQKVLREVRIALLEADVALPVVIDLISCLKKSVLGVKVTASLNPSQVLIGLVHKELTSIMGGNIDANAREISLATKPPATILAIGLQGSGKTTTVAKLAYWFSKGMYRKNGHKIGRKRVLAVSTDTHRPAAIDQLRQLINQVGCDFFESNINQDACQIALNAQNYARLHHYEVLLIDTAGRLTIDHSMMNELSILSELTKPIETLLVVDAMQGQDAINTAKGFSKKLPITGVILSKIDSDSRGGAAISVVYTIEKPLKFTGISEKIDGLELFHPERMARQILGMGDIVSLVEQAEESISFEESKEIARKIKSGNNFNLNDFQDQLNQVRKLGSFSSLLSKLPTNIQQGIGENQKGEAEKFIRRSTAILSSMTKKERKTPEIIKAARKRRIASGSGTSIQSVNQLLSQFEQTKSLMKKFNKNGIRKIMSLISSKTM